MSGFVTEPIGNAALTGGPGENAPTSLYPASVWDSQDWFGATAQLARATGRASAVYGDIGEFGQAITAPEPTLAPDELNKQFGIQDQLHFDNPLPASVAEEMNATKRAELMRADAASRQDNWGVTKFAAGLAAGAVDPLNIAATMVPVVGEARVMGWLARAGVDALPGATTAARFGAGAIGAATAQVPLVALRYGLSQQEHADYAASDAMADIVMGGLFGGGLHTAIGGLRDVIGSRFARSAVSRLVDDDPTAREAATRAAVAQLAQGEPVNLRSVLDSTALRTAYADRLAAAGDTAEGNYAAFAPDGTRVELRPEVVEAGDLITSHQDDGTVNPAYPHAEGLQGRDRSSLASQEQIGKIAASLKPELLGPSPDAAAGAPIANAAGAVESGNGRVTALRRVHNDPALADQAAAYRAYLEARGHDTTGMKAPVLIGRRVNQMTPDAVRSYTRSANERATLGMSAAETARGDASRVAAAVNELQPGPLHGTANQGFVGAFLAQLPPEERGAMLLADGRLSAPGEARIRQALLAHAYGDALGPTLERVLNGDVEHMKSVAGALTDAAGMWSRLRAAAAGGEIPAGLDITPAVGEAVQILDRARSSGTPLAKLLAQADLIGGPSPAARGLLRLAFHDENYRQPVARAKLAELLDAYVRQALEAKPGPDLFGTPETTAADIMRTVAGGDARGQAAATGLETAPAELTPKRASLQADAGESPPAEPEAPAPTPAEPAAAPAEARSAPAAAAPKELVQQIDSLTRDFTDAADRLDPEAQAELARIEEADQAAQSVLDGIQQAASCLLGGLS